MNLGVEVEQIKSYLEQAPNLRMDIHLIVLPGTQRWESAVDRVAAELAGAVSARWSASRPVLDRLAPLLPVGSEQWVELWPPRDGSFSPSGDGVLAMLIEPGTKGDADLASISVVASPAQEVRVGVDGGVTLSVASSALAAGAGYLVIGRALFGPTPELLTW